MVPTKSLAVLVALLPAAMLFVHFKLPDKSRLKSNNAIHQAWRPRAAAKYLDQRTTWWMDNMGRIDQGTSCVSCHTALPFAMARPSLRSATGETGLSPAETQLLASVSKRVEQSKTMQPFLSGPAQSKGTESVINALVLTSYQNQIPSLKPDVQTAFRTFWSRQIKIGADAGSWNWFSLGNEPWEAPDSQYWGATLAALAVGKMPISYRLKQNIQYNIKLLKNYLLTNCPEQSLHNQLSILIAAHYWKGLLSANQKQAIVNLAISKEDSDGGWRTANLILNTWKRNDGTDQHLGSDGYATGLVTYALELSGCPDTQSAIHRGRKWLLDHQSRTTGGWIAYSVNKHRDLNTDIGKFMSDAATAYAILAITHK